MSMSIIWVNIFALEGQFKLSSTCCNDHEGPRSSGFALLPVINSPKYTPSKWHSIKSEALGIENDLKELV